MASIRKQKKSRYWYACYTNWDGKRIQVSTKTTDRKEAQRLADKFEFAVRRRVTASQASKIIQDIVAEINPGEDVELNISAKKYASSWLSRKKNEWARVTFEVYDSVLNDFLLFIGNKSTLPMSLINKGIISSYRDSTAERTTPSTANNKLKIIRTFFGDAWRDGLVSENPASKVRVLKKDESNRRAFTIDELKLIMEKSDEEWKGMILCGLYTGQRLGDIARLTWQSIDMDKKQVRMLTSKTRRPILLPISEPFFEWLEGRCANYTPMPSNYVFSKNARIIEGKPNAAMLSQRFKRILESTGLVPKGTTSHKSKGIGRENRRSRNELSFHCLRHTATTLLKDAGVPESVVRDIIGHESAAVSRLYTHVPEEAKAKAIKALPRL